MLEELVSSGIQRNVVRTVVISLKMELSINTAARASTPTGQLIVSDDQTL
jgi:hypothetical protein